MAFKVRIEHGFGGVTVQDMEQNLTWGGGEVELRWTNTPAEIQALQAVRDRDVLLVVKDIAALERTVSSLGLFLTADHALLVESVSALDAGWRDFTIRNGAIPAQALLMEGIATYVRTGMDHRNLRGVLMDCLFANASPVDTDVLLILRDQGARP